MAERRVVITGRGAVSPFGLGAQTLFTQMWVGASAVRAMPEWSGIQGLTSLIAAPVPELDARSLLPRAVRRTLGPAALYAILAAKEAVAEAGLSEQQLQSETTGVAIGSTTGSVAAYEEFFSRYIPNKTLSEIKSGEFFKIMGHSCAANVCLALGISGEQWAPVSACTSSSQAIGLGYLLIKAGRQEVVLCGGADEASASVTGVFDLLRAASSSNSFPQEACRPFHRQRNGVVCGGGSGILVLEEYQSAMARGATIYGEILGYGNVTDSGHIANPDQRSMTRAMQAALSEAGVTADQVDYVNAHATGTEQGDVAEATAIAQAISGKVPVSSLKGHIGHTLGAAGALELIVVLEMMQRGELLPTRNLNDADPACMVARLLTEAENKKLTTVVKNNFALGGVNTSLVLRSIAA